MKYRPIEQKDLELYIDDIISCYKDNPMIFDLQCPYSMSTYQGVKTFLGSFVDSKDNENANGVHGLNMTFDNGKPLISEIAEVKMGNAPYIEDRNTLNTIANESKFTIGIKISEGKIEKAYKV